MNNNPWLVESIQDFYFLKCPECDFDSKEENSFQNHAVENHPLSFVFFIKSEPETIENIPDVSILLEDTETIKPEYNDTEVGYYDEPIENEPVSIKDEKYVIPKDQVNIMVKNFQKRQKSKHKKVKGNAEPKSKDRPKKKFLSCKICNSPFDTKPDLDLHLKTAHEGKSHLCSDCGKSFSQMGNLRNHIALKHGGDKLFKCPDCAYVSVLKKQLTSHINGVHEGKKPYLCSQCGFRSVGKSALKQHVNSVHEGKKPHMCSICGTSFSRAFGLKEHISMVHEGNKPFQCSTCDYKCSMKSSLDKHVRCVHEKRKPYNCTICEKSFFTKVAVNRHTLAVHEKQKNFNCHLCNLSFSIKCNLKRHILSVHEKVKVKKSIKKESKLIDQVLIQN